VGEDHEVRPASQALPERAPDLPPVEELVGEALDAAPSVVEAVAVERSREADRLAAYTPYLPSVRLSGGYDWFAFQFPPDQQSWSLRLFASLPVFNGFQREATVQRARAAERSAEAWARDARLAVRVDVETATQQIALAERRVEISDRGLELAREDLRVQEERYQIGSATIVDLQTSQVALGQAEVDAITARQALGSAVARLEAILGRELDRSIVDE
jgi:outer membrane protein TolC